MDKISTSFAVKLIRIGSYSFEPREKVIFSSVGMRIIAPNVKRENENVILDIQKNEIVKIACHLGNSMAVLFIFATKGCGAYVRESLEMSRSSDIYYDPSGGTELTKRIVLQMDSLSEEAKTTVKSIFPVGVIDEIAQDDAIGLLERCLSNNKTIKVDTSANSRYVFHLFIF